MYPIFWQMQTAFWYPEALATEASKARSGPSAYAKREHAVPYLGLCLGMQLAIVEFARNMIGYADAHSVELNPSTTTSDHRPDAGPERCGGHRRNTASGFLSLCHWTKPPKPISLYQEKTIYERHQASL